MTVTFAAVDWIMSLEPAVVLDDLRAAHRRRAGAGGAGARDQRAVDARADRSRSPRTLTPRHFHDLGKLMLAFVMLWAYLSFSQFLIIWSGNLPEEIPWYLERMPGGWQAVSRSRSSSGTSRCRSAAAVARPQAQPRLLAKVAVVVLVDAPRGPHLAGRTDVRAPRASRFTGWTSRCRSAWPASGCSCSRGTLRSRALLPVNDPYFKEAFAHEAH